MNISRRGLFGVLAGAIVAPLDPEHAYRVVFRGTWAYAGVISSTETFWRNRGNHSIDDLLPDFTRIYNDCARGVGGQKLVTLKLADGTTLERIV